MAKYTIIKNKINDNKIKYQFTKSDNSKLTYAEFLSLLKNKDKDFLKFFRRELTVVPSALDPTSSDSPTKGYFWKCVPVSKNTINKEFEFIAIKTNAFDNIKHDYSSFQEHFKGNSDVVSFSSRSGDTLIVPAPKKESDFPCPYPGDEIVNYKNIDKFNDIAPSEQWDGLWQKVGEKMEEGLNSGGTRWLNTHGLAVPHLHIRLDKSAKYYDGCEEYQVEAQIPPVNNDNNQDDNQTITTIRTNTKQTITKLLADNNLKTSDLDKKFAAWETDLEKLDDKEKINEFQQQLEKEIQVLKDKKGQKSESKNNQNKGLSLPVKIAIGGVAVVAVLALIGVIWHLAKKKKKTPQK